MSKVIVLPTELATQTVIWLKRNGYTVDLRYGVAQKDSSELCRRNLERMKAQAKAGWEPPPSAA